jgi:hypothetical protein
MPTAIEYAVDLVASVRDDPTGRLALMGSLYEAEPGRPELHLPFRRAALGFMGWQLRRGLLDAPGGETPGSPWWRAVNERLLRDTAEARAHVLGLVGPVLGDPRLAITSIFVSLSRVMPDRYPLTRDLRWYIDNEHGFGRVIDVGLIRPRFGALYAWSAAELAIPELSTLVQDGVPTYAWNATDAEPWNPAPDRLARAARSALPAPGRQR